MKNLFGGLFFLLLFYFSARGWGALFFRFFRSRRKFPFWYFFTGSTIQVLLFYFATFPFSHYPRLISQLLIWSGFAFHFFYLILGSKTLKIKILYRKANSFSVLYYPAVIIYLVYYFFDYLRALMPPMEWDAMMYQLALPRIYLKNSLFVPPSDIPWAFYPPLSQIFYTMGMAVGGELGAKMFSILWGSVLYWLVVFLMRRFFTYYWWTGVWYFASLPLSGYANVKFGTENFEMVGFIFLLHFLLEKEIYLLIIPAIFLLYTKYTYFGYLLFLGVLAIVIEPYFRKNWKKVLIAAAIIFILIFPFLLKNYLYSASPFYPMRNPFFKSRYPWVEGFGTSTLYRDFGIEKSFFDYILLPWRLSMEEMTFNYEWSGIGYLQLSVLPVILLLTVPSLKSRRVYDFLKWSATYYLFWMLFIPHITRFLFPFLVVFFLAIPLALNILKKAGRTISFYVLFFFFFVTISFYPQWPNYFVARSREINWDVILGKVDYISFFTNKDSMFDVDDTKQVDIDANNFYFINWAKKYPQYYFHKSREIKPYYFPDWLNADCIRWKQELIFLFKEKDPQKIISLMRKKRIDNVVLQHEFYRIAYDLLFHPLWGNWRLLEKYFKIKDNTRNFLFLVLKDEYLKKEERKNGK